MKETSFIEARSKLNDLSNFSVQQPLVAIETLEAPSRVAQQPENPPGRSNEPIVNVTEPQVASQPRGNAGIHHRCSRICF